MGHVMQQVYDGGLVDLQCAQITAPAASSTALDFGRKCHELTVWNNSGADIWIAYDGMEVVDATLPATAPYTKRTQATQADFKIPTGNLFQRACRFRYVYILTTADTVVNGTDPGGVLVLGGASGTAMAF